MTSILTDSIARDHAATIQATAAASRRAREARQARRAARAARRSADGNSDSGRHAAASVGHAASRPFTAMHNWLVAGQL